MAAKYTLELFPTEGNWEKYLKWFGGEDVQLSDANAGVDLYCVKNQVVSSAREATLLDLGVKARMTRHWQEYNFGATIKKKGYCHFWLAPRSSIWKSGVRQANSIGVIDKSYRGVLMGAVLANKDPDVEYVGVDLENTRLFQIIAPDMGNISRVVLKPLSELDTTERGEGGFGSTGQ